MCSYATASDKNQAARTEKQLRCYAQPKSKTAGIASPGNQRGGAPEVLDLRLRYGCRPSAVSPALASHSCLSHPRHGARAHLQSPATVQPPRHTTARQDTTTYPPHLYKVVSSVSRVSRPHKQRPGQLSLG